MYQVSFAYRSRCLRKRHLFLSYNALKMLHDRLSVLGLAKLFSVDQYYKTLQLTLFLKLIFDALEFVAVVLFHFVFIIKEKKILAGAWNKICVGVLYFHMKVHLHTFLWFKVTWSVICIVAQIEISSLSLASWLYNNAYVCCYR